ncbi:MAG: PEP/pyruvate-binding domain-containing protein [bacterium]
MEGLKKNISWFSEIGIKDVPLVGGKNASLGEMIKNLIPKGVNVPNGFATTADAYFYFLEQTGLKSQISEILTGLDAKNIKNLQEKGLAVRKLILGAELPQDFKNDISSAYKKLSQNYGSDFTDVAVRSSATAEDLPGASFAGQQETYLNVVGDESVLEAVKKCFASLFTDRAIAYRQEMGFEHTKVGLSAGIQKMVRSDLGSSGVMFSCDTESGFGDVVLINASYGLGENVVQGAVEPDQYYVFETTLKKGFRPIIEKRIGSKLIKMVYSSPTNFEQKLVSGGSAKKSSKLVGDKQNLKAPTKNIATVKKERESFVLSDEEILQLAKWSLLVEEHYKKSMDMEWAKDGRDGKLYIVQARPETVQSKKNVKVLEDYVLKIEKLKNLKILAQGMSVGSKIGQGKANKILSAKDISKFMKGEVLVTKMTDPDWVPVMKIASAIITDSGGRTCFDGNTKVLTNNGFLTIKEIVKECKNKDINVLSVNTENLNIEWKKVLNGFSKKAEVVKASVSQTGRMLDNTFVSTKNHKFFVFNNRKGIFKELGDILGNGGFLTSVSKIPNFKKENFSNELAYLLGGISTDGSIYLSDTHGEVQFIQKPTPEKKQFIEKMTACMKECFGYDFHECKKKTCGGTIKGRRIFGSANAYRCYSKDIAIKFKELEKKIISNILNGSNDMAYNFLAGVIDGDGTYNGNSKKINIFCSEEFLLEAIVVACLKLRIAFQVTKNRNIHNVQLLDKFSEIFKYTQRVKGEILERKKFGINLFSSKQLLEDIIERVNFLGRIRPYVENNFLIDGNKIKNNLIPMIAGQQENHELTKIVESDLKMYRVNFIEGLEKQKVYDIEVEDNHNFLVFTSKLTPLIAHNCHAAIIGRELGVPVIVGSENGTKVLKSGQEVTVDCSGGEEGKVYEGIIPFEIKKTDISNIPETKTKILMNVGEPSNAFNLSFIPNDGVGLAREEFIIANEIKIHPMALINYADSKAVVHPRQSRDKSQKPALKKKIDALTLGYDDKVQFYIDKLAEGIGKIGAAFYPKPVIVRFSDFKTNEYRSLVGGELYEPEEENPMIGFRGASRYYDKKFKDAFILECKAMNKVRGEFGLANVVPMVPFCRTLDEGRKVVQIIRDNGVKGRIYVMCEVPSNVILAEKFLEIFDGFSIGSNDLTQLALGLDRDNSEIASVGNEKNEAVKELIEEAIKVCQNNSKYIGICGQGPSDFPDFAQFLVEKGIESISLNPDSVLKTKMAIAQTEKQLYKKKS